jgi:hypothetical protein
MKNPNDPIGNQTRGLPGCSAVPLRAPYNEIPVRNSEQDRVEDVFPTSELIHASMKHRKAERVSFV